MSGVDSEFSTLFSTELTGVESVDLGRRSIIPRES